MADAPARRVGPGRRAAVLGRPIAHSLSPVIHNAGYAAAGLSDWSYDAHDCGEEELAGFVAGLGPEWVGLSLTMPLKEVALAVADAVSDRAAALGAANTLVRRPDGTWWAENTDAPGMVDALRGVLINFNQFPPHIGLAVIAGMCVMFFVAALVDFNRS